MQFSIPVEELRFYDVISQSLMVEEGCYIIGAGISSANILIKTEIQIPGKKQGNVISLQRIPDKTFTLSVHMRGDAKITYLRIQ